MLEVRLPASPEAAARARESIQELRGSLEPRVFEDLRLLVSELVTNSLRHAGVSGYDEIRLRVELAEDAVRVEVWDRGPGFTPRQPVPTLYSEAGWGLFLVRQLASRWGIRGADTTCVWFELPLAA